MKKLFLVLPAALLCILVSAQGNSGKAKDKEKNKPNNPQVQPGNSTGNQGKINNNDHDRYVWEGIADPGCGKASKNQPAKVRSSFQRDYPYAVNVYWTKCRGDWTATFNSGLFRSTAVYHANGDRRDTRTWVVKADMPRRILDVILQRQPGISIEGAIKIQVPNIVKDIFRIRSIIEGKPQFIYLDAEGSSVTYNY